MVTALVVVLGLAVAFLVLALAIAWLPAGGFGTGDAER